MTQIAATFRPETVSDEHLSPQAVLEQTVEHAAHLLPAQGPINVFIHHNTLHAFEHLPFDEGVQTGARVFGCEPYLSEDQYRQRLASERITFDDLAQTLAADLGDSGQEKIAGLVERFDLRLAMLQYPLQTAEAHELRWFVAETDALAKFRADIPAHARQHLLDETKHWVMRDLLPRANGNHEDLLTELAGAKVERFSAADWEALTLRLLWRVCKRGTQPIKGNQSLTTSATRPRDLLLRTTGIDTDQLVNEVLIRFCSAFLDQGLSHWDLPEREQGFFWAFGAMYAQPVGPPDSWLQRLSQELQRQREQGLSAIDSALESLELLGVPQEEWESFVTSTFLALRGWGGMMRQMEVRADRAAQPVPVGSLMGFLAVRLLLDRLAAEHVARSEFGYRGPLSELSQKVAARTQVNPAATAEQQAFRVFQLAQIRGWLPSELRGLSVHDWEALAWEINAFPELERRRILHAAFERRYRQQVLDAFAIHADHRFERVKQPRFQLVTCLDEREESFRRHLEEVAPDVETFGAAGFYNVAMYYRGAADANFIPLCPIIIRPQHWVEESPVYSLHDVASRRKQTRKILGTVSHKMQRGSRTFAGGALLTAGFGALATVPLVARVLFPRLTSRIRKTASHWVQPPSVTQLELERNGCEASCEEGHLGFTVDEMVNIGERLLRDIGLTTGFARIVTLLGHGSNSVNNPHKSAYDCGACGGNAGGPNARAIARILNDARVRDRLRERGIDVPHDTWFVGGLHNTCNDEVTFLDLDRLPSTHRKEFDRVEADIEETCARNAHERCRRFMSAPLNMSFKAAKRHVEGRAEDLAQTRPECGHASNAVCYVGRRSRTRGLYMDRRTFLTSYDPTLDTPDHAILLRLLQAAVPVCAGINLEYYFSYVDPTGFGCGTKLPHNVTSMLGIMDGCASDLRTGLPWQMVEIHEPVRLLFVIETTPEAMLSIMDRNAVIGQTCRNGWVQLALLSPDDESLLLYRDGKFERYEPTAKELPHVSQSVEWYRGWRENLGFAQIGE